MKSCGRNVRFNPYSVDIKGLENLSVGDNVSLPNGTTIYCENATVTIGNNVKFGLSPVILTDDSYIPETMKIVWPKGKIVESNNIVIEDDVIIGHHVTILRGVKIPKGSIIKSHTVIYE